MARCASAAAGRTSWRRAPFLWRPKIDTSDRQAALSILRGTRCACIHATGWPAIRFAADLAVEGVEAIAGFCLRFRVQRHLQFAKEVFSKDGLFDELKKALAERVLNAELDDHLLLGRPQLGEGFIGLAASALSTIVASTTPPAAPAPVVPASAP